MLLILDQKQQSRSNEIALTFLHVNGETHDQNSDGLSKILLRRQIGSFPPIMPFLLVNRKSIG